MSDYTVPDFNAIALVTIDVQRDFLKGQPFEIEGTTEAIPQMRLLVEAFRRAKLPIVHMVRLYKADGSNADLCRRQVIEDGSSLVCPSTVGSELEASLLPLPGTELKHELLLSGLPQALGEKEWIFYKPRWGAFFKTTLHEHLNGLGTKSLVFCGCNFPNCPRTSIYEASERDFRIVLVEDAISGLYDQARREMANIGVALMNTAEVIRAINQKAHP
jgi:nicotinamidase-related amidase